MAKKLVILTIVLLLLGAVGYGAYIYILGTGSLPSAENNSRRLNLFPFNRNNGTTPTNPTPTNPGNEPAATSTEAEPVFIPRLRQLTKTPVAGAESFLIGTTTVVRYIDRGTGHMYETRTDMLREHKLTNTTIPKIYHAFIGGNGSSTILQYLNDSSGIITYAASIKRSVSTTSEPNELEGIFIDNGIYSIAVSPKKDRIFYLAHGTEGSVGYISKIDGSGKRQLFTTPLKELSAGWVNEERVAIQTKPSYISSGILYTLNTVTGALEKVASGVRGQSALVRTDNLKILRNQSGYKTLTIGILTLKDNSFSELPFKTLVEKCVWSKLEKATLYCAIPKNIPDAEYPDAWYQGEVLFSDELWKINSDTGELLQLANLRTESGVDIDATKLTLDPKEQFIIFTNKYDLTLWSLRMEK
jgi:hypothetical protein